LEQGLAAAARGEFIDHEEMRKPTDIRYPG
jgi:predicted transcriptional regulator